MSEAELRDRVAKLEESLSWALNMAEEAIMCREHDPEEDDTPEIIAMHRETLEEGRALLGRAS